MPDEGVYERYMQAVRELHECGRLVVDTAVTENDGNILGDVDAVRSVLASKFSEPVAEKLRDGCFGMRELHVEWSGGSDPQVHGEFCLSNVFLALTERNPPLGDPLLSSRERSVLAALKLVDQEPWSGTGRVVGMRLSEAGRDPELWFYDMPHRDLVKLDITYAQYLKWVFTVKGASGWQFLFADVDLRDRKFGSDVDNLTAAFDLLPDLFPDHDYSDLRARLEARL